MCREHLEKKKKKRVDLTVVDHYMTFVIVNDYIYYCCEPVFVTVWDLGSLYMLFNTSLIRSPRYFSLVGDDFGKMQ